MDAKGRDAESPWKMPWAAWRSVAVRSWNESSDDNIGLVAAGVAFYGFLALVPLITAVVLCYGIFADPGTVVRHMQALAEIMPGGIARMIGDQMLALVHASDGKKGLGALLAFGLALFGARNGAGAIIVALNIAYEEKEKRSFLWLNLTSLAITAAGVAGAIAAALGMAALHAVAGLAAQASDLVLFAASALTYALLTAGAVGAAAALYRYGPSRHHARWVWISPGSLFAGLLWLALTLGFGAYVANIGRFDATYGSLGAVVALLTYLYLTSYILLFGAELNSELEHQTAQDTTIGAPQPIGLRNAEVADHVAGEPVAALPGPAPVLALPAPAHPVEEAEGGGFLASRAVVRVGRIAGLPKIGWISSGLASLGLAMLRRRGRRAAGAALLATAAGIALLSEKK